MLRRNLLLLFLIFLLIPIANSKEIEGASMNLNPQTIHKIEFDFSDSLTLNIKGTSNNKINIIILNKIEYLNFLNQDKFLTFYNQNVSNNFDFNVKIDNLTNKTVCILFINNNNDIVHLTYQIQTITSNKFLDINVFPLLLTGIFVVYLKKQKNKFFLKKYS